MLNDPEGIDPPEEPFVYQELLHQGSAAVKQALAMAETTPDSTPHDMTHQLNHLLRSTRA